MYLESTMANNDSCTGCSKECFNEVAILVPLGVAVICILALALCLHHYWNKSRSGYVSFNDNTEAHTMGNLPRQQLVELTKQLEGNQKEISRLKAYQNNTKMKIGELKQELGKVRKGKDAAELRLSEMMSTQRKDMTPNCIENCTTELRDKFSNLYDNIYTDATTDLENTCAASYSSEDEFTKEMSVFMLDILMFAFKACMENAQKQLLTLEQLMLDPSNEVDLRRQGSWSQMKKQLPQDFMEKVKDQRKTISPDLAFITSRVDSQMADRYSGSPLKECLDIDSLRSYTKQCVEITWLMAIQDPPMYLNFNEERKDCLREYTRIGPTFDFLVWPPLYLNKGGSMMVKGVAQFRK